MTTTALPPNASTAAAGIVLAAAFADLLAELADGAARRFPDLADRLYAALDRASVVDDINEVPAGVVTLGSRVRFRDDTTGREQTVTLVLPQEADIGEGRISVVTPIGVALVGLQEGASSSWEARDGQSRQLTLLEVTPPGDA